MKAALLLFTLISLSARAEPLWRPSLPGWIFEFPRDHFAHPEFKTEWWYFTGNLFDASGSRFGYELTFFREGIRSPTNRDPGASRFIIDDLKFAHFAITDVGAKQFHFEQKMNRGAFGEAGFDDGQRIAWIENWSLVAAGDDAWDVAGAGTAGAGRAVDQPRGDRHAGSAAPAAGARRRAGRR